ncbi:MAG: hypothetical protein IK093_06900, partial [Ruminiclostridium sp.]|nr:hypothetical protein [Ruminiclostridium sp.]
MLAGANTPEPEPEPAKDESSGGGMLTQEQIEAMLAGANTPEPEPEPAKAESSGGGMLTQEQIEAMLAGESQPEPEPKPAKTESSGSGMLTQEQIEALISGESEPTETEDLSKQMSQEEIQKLFGGDDLTNEPKVKAKPVEKQSVPDNKAAIAALLDEDEAETEPEPVAEPPEAEDEKEPEKPVSDEKTEENKDEAPKKNKLGKIIGAVIPFVAVAAAGAAGFAACLLLNTDMIRSSNENFAIKAANAYNSSLPINSDLCIYKAYVRNNAASDECMLYSISEHYGVKTIRICRVVVEHNDPDVINLYYVIDTDNESYKAMKDSPDSQTRIQASMLKNYSDQIIAADLDIHAGSEEWERVDCTKINAHIDSEQIKT